MTHLFFSISLLFICFISVLCFAQGLEYGGRLNGVDGLDGPESVTVSPDNKNVYVAAGVDDAVAWFQRDSNTGALVYQGHLKDGANGVDGLDGASSVTVSPDDKHVYVTSITDDAVSWFQRDSSTGALVYQGHLKDGANGVDGLDYANDVTVSPDGKHVYVVAAEDDAVSWFQRDSNTGALVYQGHMKDGANGVDGLDGARSVTVSPDAKHVYVASFYDDAVSWFQRDSNTGALSYQGHLKDGENGVDGLDGARSVTVSPDAKHVYVASFYDDAVSRFQRDSSTGALLYQGRLKDGENGVDGLDGARSVTVSPDNKHVYVAARNDNTVSWFQRDSSTGALSYQGSLKDGENGVDGLAEASSVAVSPDNKHVYVTAIADDAVSWFTQTRPPTVKPTPSPTPSPNVNPTPSPNVNPTPSPNVNPTLSPNVNPTSSPTINPTPPPNVNPTPSQTIAPTKAPTFCPMNTQNGQEYTRFDSCTDQGALITTINFETQVGPNECARRCINEILPIGHCKSGAYNSQQKTCKLFNIKCNLQAYDKTNDFVKTFYCHSAIAPTSSPNNPPTSSPNNSPTSSPNNSPTSPTPASTADEGSSDSVGTIIGVSVGVLAFAGVAYITFKKKKIPGVYGSDVETAT